VATPTGAQIRRAPRYPVTIAPSARANPTPPITVISVLASALFVKGLKASLIGPPIGSLSAGRFSGIGTTAALDELAGFGRSLLAAGLLVVLLRAVRDTGRALLSTV
jgi:hypothetical protein